MAIVLERPFPTTFEPQFHVLQPEQGLGEEADEVIAGLAAHGFVAARGIHKARAGDLTLISRDPKIEEYCPDDRTKRFANIPVMSNWVRTGTGRAAIGVYHVDNLHGPVALDDLPHITVYDVTAVAHGWGGEKANMHIPGADITTAYRVSSRGSQLARESRVGPDDRFRLGPMLGLLVIENLVHSHGVPRKLISLENWKSNQPAADLYDQLGFHEVPGIAPVPGVRPTLKPVGTLINGNVVTERVKQDEKTGLALVKHVVDDERVFQVLAA